MTGLSFEESPVERLSDYPDHVVTGEAHRDGRTTYRLEHRNHLGDPRFRYYVAKGGPEYWSSVAQVVKPSESLSWREVRIQGLSLYECFICGALVLSQMSHEAWHEREEQS